MRDSLTQLERCHQQGGIVPWSTFAGDQAAHCGKVVELRAADFQSGTLRIKESCTLRLRESVLVNPNRPSIPADGQQAPGVLPRARRRDWFPDLSDPQQRAEYGTGDVARAYRLGFFASIAIETEGVILDLGGHTLQMHPEFALQQRFHALIELADQPFIMGQGPADFGQTLRSAKCVWIRNGTLGRSAHHGIHGNGAEDILISDLVLRDYEVAAIALNGGEGLAIEDCRLEGHRTDTPVLGTYSAGRFIRRLAYSLLGRVPAPPELGRQCDELRSALDDLDRALDATFARVILGADSAPDPLFHNESGSTDGNAYAIVVHGRGAVVGGLIDEQSDEQSGEQSGERIERARDVWIRDVEIDHTHAAIREIVALAEPGAAPLQDPIGAILPLWPHGGQPGNMDEQGRACPTVLGAVQLRLSALLQALPAEVTARLAPPRVPPSIVGWSHDPRRRLVPSADDPRQRVLVDDCDPCTPLARFELRCNGDSMHHVNKGVIGVFIQAVDGLVLERVGVDGVVNAGEPGSDLAGPYIGPTDGGHLGQERQLGYGGADARGVYLGACSDARVRGLRISNVESAHGSAHGIELSGGTRRVVLRDCALGRVTAGSRRDPSPGSALYPNRPARAVGIRVDQTTASVSVLSCTFGPTPTQPGPAPGRSIELSCETAQVDLRPSRPQADVSPDLDALCPLALSPVAQRSH